mmetsp:Transcript_115308/g.298948  ORF Transcript_115308/g.298948 Transcript_115308/m.298948 type:complete len:159 (-) Transcript_115308:184-660(-)
MPNTFPGHCDESGFNPTESNHDFTESNIDFTESNLDFTRYCPGGATWHEVSIRKHQPKDTGSAPEGFISAGIRNSARTMDSQSPVASKQLHDASSGISFTAATTTHSFTATSTCRKRRCSMRSPDVGVTFRLCIAGANQVERDNIQTFRADGNGHAAC